MFSLFQQHPSPNKNEKSQDGFMSIPEFDTMSDSEFKTMAENSTFTETTPQFPAK